MRIIQQQGPRVITTFESAEELNNENIEKFNQLMKGKKNFFFFTKINTNNTHIFIFLWRLWFFWFLQTNQSSNPFSWDTHCVSYFSSAKYRPARWKFLATQLHICAYCTKTQNLTNLKKKKTVTQFIIFQITNLQITAPNCNFEAFTSTIKLVPSPPTLISEKKNHTDY